MSKREIVALKEWNAPPEIHLNLESAKQSLRGRDFWFLDKESKTDESKHLGPSSTVQIEYWRFWDDEHHYGVEKDWEFERQENFSGILAEISTARSSLKQIATHIAGHVVVGGLYENDPEVGHRFNWATVIPNPPLKNWKPYLGMCDDKFANEPLDCFINNKADATRLAIYTLGGQAAEEIMSDSGQLSGCDERNFEIVSKKYGINKTHALDTARSFLGEHKQVLENVVDALDVNLVLSEKQITKLLTD
jgi:hypothetical protein